jgi:hypothetical protein
VRISPAQQKPMSWQANHEHFRFAYEKRLRRRSRLSSFGPLGRPKISLWIMCAQHFLKNLFPAEVPLTFFKHASLGHLCPLQNRVLVAVGSTFLLLRNLPPSKSAPGECLKQIFQVADILDTRQDQILKEADFEEAKMSNLLLPKHDFAKGINDQVRHV